MVVAAGWLLCAGLLFQPAASAPAVPTAPGPGPLLRLVQEKPIKGQDPMQDPQTQQGATGWVQAPLPRGENAPKEGQGAGAGQAGVTEKGGQEPAGQNPGTPVTSPLPNPSGMSPGTPAHKG